MRKLPLYFGAAAVLATGPCLADAGDAATVRLSIDPSHPVGHVDPRIYGQFFEHIYHSANGGLWGEMVWNRSFEESPGTGLWRVEDAVLRQLEEAVDVRLTFGDPAWTDYEYTLQARKIGGSEGFLILFRVAGDDDFYWLNLGGWGNVRHALERGRAGEGRWGVVYNAGEGSIATGRWYTIRIRCQGKHYQAWLDDQRVMDFTDDDKAHLHGQVGVGTWSTRAEFRNLKVTTLDGRVLYQGIPSTAVTGEARHWTAYGPGTVGLDTDRALNSRLSLRITADGDETGVEQGALRAARSDVCHGSLWLRGKADGHLVVRLSDGDKVLAEQQLAAPTADWQEQRFELKPRAACGDATLRVGLVGKGTAWVDQVSLMPESAAKVGGFRPDLLDAVAQLHPPVIRWPGGAFAEFYRWRDGIGPQYRRGRYPISIWDDVDTNSLGTDEFVDLCRRVGAEPLLVINGGRHAADTPRADYVREACQWIEYCNGAADSQWGKVRAANGHPEPYGVKLWEIDNETWSMGPEAYSDLVREFVPAMKAVDPSIQIAACGSAGYGTGGSGLAWNKVVLGRCAELFDYLSIHHYEGPDRFNDGPRAYEAFFRQNAEVIAACPNPKVKLFVSEWNAQSTDWRTGLYCGGLLNAFERCSDVVAIGSPALFLRHVSAAEWDNAFINFDQNGWFPAPNYVVMKLWWDHYLPSLLAVEGEAGPLNVSAAASEDGKRVVMKVVNPSDQAAAVELKLPVEGAAKLWLVAPGELAARNTLAEPHQVKAEEAEVRVEDGTARFTMPPLSAGVLVVGG